MTFKLPSIKYPVPLGRIWTRYSLKWCGQRKMRRGKFTPINLRSSTLSRPKRGHQLVNLCHCVWMLTLLYHIKGFVWQENLPMIYYVIKWV